MTGELLTIFVDFNRRTDTPNTYATWASQIEGAVPLGEPVILTDHEDLTLEGHISGVDFVKGTLLVTVGHRSAPMKQNTIHMQSLSNEQFVIAPTPEFVDSAA